MSRLSNKKNIIFLLFFVSCSINNFINAQELDTEILNTTNGLSNNKVLHIFQDSYGLLWIGTEYGLNVYDGHEFKIFKNNLDDTESINSNVIWCIVEDTENNLWIATGAGVSKYFRDKNNFKNYDLGIGRSYYSSVEIYIDLKRNIWAAVEGEDIRKYNKLNDTWDKQKFVLIDSSKVYSNPAHIFEIIEDKNRKLWIASLRYGLMWFDENENIFRQSNLMDKEEVTDFTTRENFMIDLYEDSSGVFWITTKNGIYKYNTSTNVLKTIEKYTVNKFSSLNNYNSITTDQFGNIWITNNFHGLLKFDGITDNYKTMKITAQNYSSDGISDIILTESLWDRSGIFWIGTLTKGLIRYDSNKKVFAHYVHDEHSPNSISSSVVRSLLESKVYPGKIYVGTRGGGLNFFDTKTNNFSTIPFDDFNDKFSGSVRSIIEEEDGSLWLGTWGDGLLKLNPERKIVERFIPDSTDLNSISDNQITVICKDSLGNLWIGTKNGCLNYLDVQTNTFKSLRNGDGYKQEIVDLIKNKIDQNLDEAKIINVRDSQNLSAKFKVENPGDYLVVTAGEGDGRRDSLMFDYGWLEDSNKKIIWSSDNVDSTYHVGGDIKNRVKIGTLKLNAGKYSLKYKSDDSHNFGKWNMDPPVEQEFWGIRIFRIDNKSELDSIQEYIMDIDKKLFIKGSHIITIHQSKNNIVWVGTQRYGFQKINKNDNSVRTYLFDRDNNRSFKNIIIYDIYENNKGILWLATSRGLIEFDPVKETFSKFTDQDGLPANSILSILPGDNNELWIYTNNGISKMTIAHTKSGRVTGKPTFVNYSLGVDVGGMDYSSLVKLKTIDGNYFFGGNNGLNEFDSKKFDSQPPKLIFSDLKISNVSVLKMGKDSPVKTSIMTLANLSLSHIQNDLSFEFAALHFSDPKKNKYAHQLEGYEDGWIYDNSRIATYTNLDPGEYTFRFKGSNSDGVWNEQGASLKIIIAQPWWQTWWAYIIYLLVTLFAIYSIRRYELNKAMLKNQLKLEHIEAEKLRELDQVKSRFFANISHEFRTPLTLILGQINSLHSTTLDSKIKSKLEVANRNARRLLQLINQLLDLSKIESGSMNIKCVSGDIVSFIKNIFYSFESLADQKKITINCNSNYTKIELNYDPKKIEKVFFNLLSNAFKFTPDGGEIKITIKHFLNSDIYRTAEMKDMSEKSGFVEIHFSDTGSGISSENLPHLFDRFYQADNSTTREHQGTGIGLALSKELVELHDGKISVESKNGEGSTFIVQLPFEECKLTHNESLIMEAELSESTNNNVVETNDLLSQAEEDIPLLSTNDIKKNEKEIILVVEDNSDVRNYIVEQLINNFQVLVAKDGQKGISLAKKRIPDLIITDVMMPKIDGFQLTSELKQDEKTSHIPIVMLTAKASLDNKIEGLEIGADDYLIKPFNSEELLVRVKNLIATRRQLRRQFSKATIIKPSDVTAVSMDQRFLQKVLNAVDNHIEDEQFGVEKLAEEANMSVSQLNRKLGALIDQSAGKLIRSMRLKMAVDLMKRNSGTLAEISYQVGFRDQTSFTRAFKKRFGDSPSKYIIKLTGKG
jgi:signal transduction histidine kinase/ligand-binding sensor domain-containing protein/DNA-binding response OmpR family regulator